MVRNSKIRQREISSAKRKASASARLTVKIISASCPISTISLPVSSILERELEMENAAESFDLPNDRWQGSILYELHKKREVTLDPEQTCEEDYCHIISWKHWMTELIENFYKTGQLVVPDECQGSDLLLALEFFAVLYQPDQLIFQSFATYNRVKAWSQYLTCRTMLLEWVARRMYAQPKTSRFCFATRPAMTKESWIEFDRKRLPVFEGGMPVEACQNLGKRNSAEVVHEFFGRGEVADTMRADFCLYVLNALSNVEASFTVEAVTVHCSDKTKHDDYRAILMITRVEPSPHSEHALRTPQSAAATRSTPTRRAKESPGDDKPSKSSHKSLLDNPDDEHEDYHPSSRKGVSENSPRAVYEVQDHDEARRLTAKSAAAPRTADYTRGTPNQSTSKRQPTHAVSPTPRRKVREPSLYDERSNVIPFSVIEPEGFKTVASGLSESRYYDEEAEVHVHDVSSRMRELLRSDDEKKDDAVYLLNATTETEESNDSDGGFSGWLFSACGDMTCGLPGVEIEIRTSGRKVSEKDAPQPTSPARQATDQEVVSPPATPTVRPPSPRPQTSRTRREKVESMPHVTKTQEKQLQRLRQASHQHVHPQSNPTPPRPPKRQSRYEEDFRREEERSNHAPPKAMVKNRMKWSEELETDDRRHKSVGFSDEMTGAQGVIRDFDQSHTRYCGQSFFRKKPSRREHTTDEHGVAESKKGIRRLMCKLPSQF